MADRPVRTLAVVLIGFTAISEVSAATTSEMGARSQAIPEDFPEFVIDGRPDDAMAMRDLFWQHVKDLTPKATLWDEWLLPPTLWPHYTSERVAERWRRTLLSRHIDPDGYVATHQHNSIAHQRGWPFPGWHQSPGSFGWHFAFGKAPGPPWRADVLANPDDWITTGVKTAGVDEEGWLMTLAEPGAVVALPHINHSSRLAPFMQVRWRADGLTTTAQPYLEWTTHSNPEFSREQRMYFDQPASDTITYTMVPMYQHPQWRDQTVTDIRLHFDNQTTGAKVILQGIFPQFDTRHNVNNPSYVTACIDYFYWMGDLNFLRENIERMRLAMLFMETEFGTDEDGIVKMPWVGHEGTTGLELDADGKVTMLAGNGVGNNYWDLVPFGQKDSYATMRHFHAARKMAELEEQIATNAHWNIARSPLARPGDHWRDQADMAGHFGNRLFWNEETGRFTLGIDSDGQQADYGFTFVNLEAIAYDFASPENARSIMDWLDGRRVIATDTSQTTDIYHWRFAPRATTRRNVEHYGWFWNAPQSIPFGDQVQDGGAVLGFSYHDIMARLRVNGADDAARRLEEIARWYAEVVDAGGYRAYYDGNSRPGNLQGGGTPGGLGLDREFFESVLVPHVLLDGFMGLRPTGDGFSVKPKLPSHWDSLRISHIAIKGNVITAEITSDTMTLTPQKRRTPGDPLLITITEQWVPANDAVELPAHQHYRPEEGQVYEWKLNTPAQFKRTPKATTAEP